MNARPSVRDTHIAQQSALTDADLRAGEGSVVDIDRKRGHNVAAVVDAAATLKAPKAYDPLTTTYADNPPPVEPVIYDAEDNTARQINDNDPEET